MKPTGATKEAVRLTELYVASESKNEEGDATIRMRTGDVWVGQVKRKHAAEIVTAVNERERLRRLLRAATSPTKCYCDAMNGNLCWQCEARAALNEVEG